MSEQAISYTLRTTPKVNAGFAPNAWSERYLDAGCLGVCPTRFPVDNFGRCANNESLVEETAGCHSALNRIIPENNIQRPVYTYAPRTIEGVLTYTPGGHYCTYGARREEAFGLTGWEDSPRSCGANGFNAEQDMARFQNAMRSKYNKTRYTNQH